MGGLVHAIRFVETLTTMPPSKPAAPLTHARVTRELRALFGEVTLARATAIQWDDDVISDFSATQTEPDTYLVSGSVQGTAPSPYDTRVEVFADLEPGEFELLETECSCPVGINCKHACALLLLWISKWPGADERPVPGSRDTPRFSGIAEIKPSSAKAKPSRNIGSRKAAEEAPAPVVRTEPVRGQLYEWLNRSIEAGQKREATGRSGAKKSAPSSVPCLFYVLTDEAMLHALRGRWRRDGSDPELTGEYTKTAWLGYSRSRPTYVRGEDVAVLTLIESHESDFYSNDPIARLDGETGAQLLSLAAGTGRLFALADAVLAKGLGKRADESMRKLSRPLAFGDACVASLTWREVTRHKVRTLRLAATIEGQPVELIPTDPPFALDLTANRIVPVNLALSTSSLAQLSALPPLALDDLLAWSYVRDAIDSLPDAGAVPPLPIADSGLVLKPRAILAFALVEYNYQHGWGRQARTETSIFPAVQLSFDYAGRRVPVSPYGLADAIEVEQRGAASRTTLARNVRAEQRWIRRLPKLLERAVAVEPALAQAALEGRGRGHSLWALPHHDWAHHGAQVFADAQAQGFEIEVDPAFPLTLEDIPEPELELTPTPDRGWFRIALGVTVQDRRVDLAPALAKLIGAQADPEAWLEALPGVPMVLLTIAPTNKDRGKDLVQSTVVRLPGVRIHAILAPVFDWFRGGELAPMSGLQAALMEGLPPAAIRYLGRDDQRWIALRSAIAEGVTFASVPPHPGFRGTLRPYQLHGLAWLENLRRLSMAAVLADDMGLGKTVQTLAFLHRRRHADAAERPSLIVAPTSVTVNWQAEAERFAPDLKLLVHRGSARSLDATALAGADLVVTSYPILQRDATRFAEIDWDVVVFDEAQMIKNAKAKTYQAAQSLNAAMRVALTGTPMENHLGELWALFNLLLPGLLGDPDAFNRVFRHPIEQRAASEQMAKLRARIRPFLLRRTREQVLADLPEKTEYTRWIELNPAQADLYESLRTAIHDDIRKVIDKKGLKQSTIHILDALLKLRQVCCDPRLVKLPEAKKRFADAGSAKLDWLMSHLPELVEEGRQVLVFSQFTSMLALIAEGLTALNIPFVTLTGDTTDRDTPIKRFQAGEVRVFLLSLKAGGVGLNLTAADTVIHYDPWWNPAVEAQATARAHRIGQNKPVFVTRLVSQGTLEERMLTLLARKRELAAALLDGEGSALTGLTMADVEELLAPISSFVAQTK